MGAWKYQIYFSCWTWYFMLNMLPCSTLEVNLVFPRIHVLFSMYRIICYMLYHVQAESSETFIYRSYEIVIRRPKLLNIAGNFFPNFFQKSSKRGCLLVFYCYTHFLLRIVRLCAKIFHAARKTIWWRYWRLFEHSRALFDNVQATALLVRHLSDQSKNVIIYNALQHW